LNKARERAHILEGLMTALDHLDEVIATIRRSRTVETARNNLMKGFKLTEAQATAILDMQLRRLAALERRKLENEYKEKKKLIQNLERLLAKPELMRLAVKEELSQVREKYGDIRRTQLVDDSSDSVDVTAADLLPDELVWVTIGDNGTLARMTGRTMPKIPARPTEAPLTIVQANTQDVLYLFGANGQAVSLPVYQLPQSREFGSGTHWADLTGFTRRQHVAVAMARPADFDGFLTLVTLGGIVKRVRLEDLPGITGTPFHVVAVADDDALGWARLTTGRDELIMVTAAGQAIRFREDEVRPMGLPASGVMGIKLANEADGLVAFDLHRQGGVLWSITDNGLAKTTGLDQYPTQGRYGQGVINMRLPRGAAEVAGAAVVNLDETIYVIQANGSVKGMKAGKATSGNRPIKPRPVMTLGKRNRVTGAVTLRERPTMAAVEND
jgi:DNA gyrase subunit A